MIPEKYPISSRETKDTEDCTIVSKSVFLFGDKVVLKDMFESKRHIALFLIDHLIGSLSEKKSVIIYKAVAIF